MKESVPLLRAVFGALLRALLPAMVAGARESMRGSCADVRPQPDLRARLQSRVRAKWGQRALAGGMLALMLVVLAGCGTKTYFVPEGEPVRLRKPIHRAAVWVMDENGRPAASKATLPAGWYVLADPGADAPEAAPEPPIPGQRPTANGERNRRDCR